MTCSSIRFGHAVDHPRGARSIASIEVRCAHEAGYGIE
jgi:hypothetical protein